MKEWVSVSISKFESYVSSFNELTDNQKRNFDIKKEHSIRVADLCLFLAEKLEFTEEKIQIAYLSGLFHDIGRFKQLVDHETFNDDSSIDHGDLAVKILEEESFLENLEPDFKNLVLTAIKNHNKFMIQDGLSETEQLFSKLLRDADKLDILNVISEHYSKRNSSPNHTLTWELPKGSSVSVNVAKEVLAGKLVSKRNIVSEMDLKIMQLSWVFDINFRPAVEYIVKNRFLEIIYSSLPKNDTVIEIYRKIKVFTENRLLSKH